MCFSHRLFYRRDHCIGCLCTFAFFVSFFFQWPSHDCNFFHEIFLLQSHRWFVFKNAKTAEEYIKFLIVHFESIWFFSLHCVPCTVKRVSTQQFSESYSVHFLRWFFFLTIEHLSIYFNRFLAIFHLFWLLNWSIAL